MSTVAQTIYEQLGGNQFAVMTGAKRFVTDGTFLRFNIGSNGSKANMVKIILRGDDTYTMQFWKVSREVNTYKYLVKYADQGLSPEEYNKKVNDAIEKAMKRAEPKMLQEYDGVYCDQLQEIFKDYTKLNTKLF